MEKGTYDTSEPATSTSGYRQVSADRPGPFCFGLWIPVTGPNMLIESNVVETKESTQFMESSRRTNWYLEGHPPSKMEQVTFDQFLDNSLRNF